MPALDGKSAVVVGGGTGIGRAGHVDDVAHACLYLAGDTARYVTGTVLAVDGGWTAS